MKYKIQFILDRKISTDRVRDIKLSLLQDSVEKTSYITSCVTRCTGAE